MAKKRKPKKVFVSYSRADAYLVNPIVEIIRGMVEMVFLDTLQIKAGEKWRERIDHAIRDCDIITLFWCAHAKCSTNVKAEYRRGLTLRKEFMPIKLDSTELPKALREYHWVDFRKHASELHPQEPPPASAFSYRANPYVPYPGLDYPINAKLLERRKHILALELKHAFSRCGLIDPAAPDA